MKITLFHKPIRRSIDNVWALASRIPINKNIKVEEFSISGIRESEGISGSDMRHITRGFGTENDTGYISGLERCTSALHQRAIKDPWEYWWIKNDLKWGDLNHDQKLNYTLIFLASNFAANLQKLEKAEGNFQLPNIPKINTSICLGKEYIQGIESAGVFGAISDGIEYAWRNRQEPRPINWQDSLNWHKVAVACMDAVYGSIDGISEAAKRDKLTEINSRIQEHMTYYGLLGKDNDYRQKENCALLTIATLSAISDYMLLGGPKWYEIHWGCIKADKKAKQGIVDSGIAIALDDSIGSGRTVGDLFAIRDDVPKLAPADNYQIEPLEEDEGL